MKTDEDNQTQREKDTGLALLLIFLLLLFFTEKMYYIYPAMFILVLTMTWPKFFAPFSYVWFGFSKILGEIVSKILLTLVFTLVAMPIGSIRKLLGSDSMKLKQWKKDNETCFTDINHSVTSDNLEKPY
jgi:ABC-type phosphate/phosphonate transport system permease subunit